MAAIADHEIFISYRHTNDALAKRLHDELLNNYDIHSFRDEEGLHFGDFRRQLVLNNLHSRVLVLLLTPGTLDRCANPHDWVTREITLFLRLGKPIIPVCLNGFTFPTDAAALPPAIRGLIRHGWRRIDCPHTDTAKAVSFVAERLKDSLRRKWSKEQLAGSAKRRFYLSRHNTAEDGYFYQSAMTFRRHACLLLLQLVLMAALHIETWSDLTLPLDLWKPLVGAGVSMLLWFSEFKEVASEGDCLIDVLLDHPFFRALKSMIGSLLTIAVPSAAISLLGYKLAPELVKLLAQPLQLIYPPDGDVMFRFGALACFYACAGMATARFFVKFLLSGVQFLNSLYSRYPANHYRERLLARLGQVLRVLGWCLLVPAVAGALYLALTVVGGTIGG